MHSPGRSICLREDFKAPWNDVECLQCLVEREEEIREMLCDGNDSRGCYATIETTDGVSYSEVYGQGDK